MLRPPALERALAALGARGGQRRKLLEAGEDRLREDKFSLWDILEAERRGVVAVLPLARPFERRGGHHGAERLEEPPFGFPDLLLVDQELLAARQRELITLFERQDVRGGGNPRGHEQQKDDPTQDAHEVRGFLAAMRRVW